MCWNIAVVFRRQKRKEMQYELKRIQQEVGITFIFVTHDQEEALTMSDKIVVMKNGIAAYLAEHKELDLLKKYSDRRNDEKARTAFDQMTDDGVERKFDCIIVASMYYCGPDFPAARQAIKETLYATGIDLIVLDEGLDTRTASRKEVEDYFEAKRCEMHAEIMFAWRRKQGAGFRLTNSVPFGYIRRNGESNMIKDEEVVQAVFEKLVLCYLLAAHSFPQRSKINQCCHHFCL